MTATTGRLAPTGTAKRATTRSCWSIGRVMVDIHECVDCGTSYDHEEGQPLTCNGHLISLCPWCRPDSRPWFAGRGR